MARSRKITYSIIVRPNQLSLFIDCCLEKDKDRALRRGHTEYGDQGDVFAPRTGPSRHSESLGHRPWREQDLPRLRVLQPRHEEVLGQERQATHGAARQARYLASAPRHSPLPPKENHAPRFETK